MTRWSLFLQTLSLLHHFLGLYYGCIPPTGKKVEWRDMVVTRFEGEKIAEEWAVSELAGQLFSKFPQT